MSDSYYLICSPKEIPDSQSKVEEIKSWLQSEGILETEPTDCVLSKNLGYKPGPNYVKVIQRDDDFTDLITCGAEFQPEREVFNAGSFDVEAKVICPKCDHDRFEELTPVDFYTEQLSPEQLKLYHSIFELFTHWTKNESAPLECHKCMKVSDLSEFNIEGNISLSNFGITFWNWPPFKEEFLKEFSAKLGAEAKVIPGHI